MTDRDSRERSKPEGGWITDCECLGHFWVLGCSELASKPDYHMPVMAALSVSACRRSFLSLNREGLLQTSGGQWMEELIRGKTLAVRKFGLDAVEASDWWLEISRRHRAVCLTDPVPRHQEMPLPAAGPPA